MRTVRADAHHPNLGVLLAGNAIVEPGFSIYLPIYAHSLRPRIDIIAGPSRDALSEPIIIDRVLILGRDNPLACVC